MVTCQGLSGNRSRPSHATEVSTSWFRAEGSRRRAMKKRNSRMFQRCVKNEQTNETRKPCATPPCRTCTSNLCRTSNWPATDSCCHCLRLQCAASGLLEAFGGQHSAKGISERSTSQLSDLYHLIILTGVPSALHLSDGCASVLSVAQPKVSFLPVQTACLFRPGLWTSSVSQVVAIAVLSLQVSPHSRRCD